LQQRFVFPGNVFVERRLGESKVKSGSDTNSYQRTGVNIMKKMFKQVNS
jgi:hypothetical protein